MENIGFIGYGNMGSALGEGFINKGYNVYYNDLDEKEVNAKFVNVDELIEKCKYIILAVKPHQYEALLQEYDFSNNIIISIAAGITSSFMEKYYKNYVLTMPNTPTLIGKGITAIVKNNNLSENDINYLITVFKSVSEVIITEEEGLSKMICMSGSSPAYFFNFIDKLSTSIEKFGISKSEAEYYLAQVMKASAEMIIQSDDSSKQLTENVCSPNGTTIQAVNTFNETLGEVCDNAIENCFVRANEMKLK